MKIKCKIKVTEGIVYDGIKEGVKSYLKTIRKALEQNGDAYKDDTGSLRHSMGYVILRNGTPVSDKDIKAYRNKPIEETGAKYSAAVSIGDTTKTVKL
ncbi:hypothetical protein [Barnesiella sp. An55]|uniref:hypothetical protein n=1 Tax=Barnesiella sp. An55 TaxID=1965646 RepID=UPI000B37A159|nr:hypothetical protein [Barnesiella sp. An55]OUN69494.1 hypothetical protein B5G10_11490 [Barnesiella sp. An55]